MFINNRRSISQMQFRQSVSIATYCGGNSENGAALSVSGRKVVYWSNWANTIPSITLELFRSTTPPKQ